VHVHFCPQTDACANLFSSRARPRCSASYMCMHGVCLLLVAVCFDKMDNVSRGISRLSRCKFMVMALKNSSAII
jgi:hypothetical protein